MDRSRPQRRQNQRCPVRRERGGPRPCQRGCNSGCSAAFSPSKELRMRFNVIVQLCKVAHSHRQDRSRRSLVPRRPTRGLPHGSHQVASQPASPQLWATSHHEAVLQRQVCIVFSALMFCLACESDAFDFSRASLSDVFFGNALFLHAQVAS